MFFFLLMLLGIFMYVFFQFNELAALMGASSADTIQIASNVPVMISLPNLRLFLGAGIVFLEVIIIILSVADKALDVIKAALRPFATIIPLVAFGVYAYRTFEPVISQMLDVDGPPVTLAAVVTAPNFETNVQYTFGAMLLFLIVVWILDVRNESNEVKRLRAENARLKRGRRS